MAEISEPKSISNRVTSAIIDNAVKMLLAGLLLFVALWGDSRWLKKTDASAEFDRLRVEQINFRSIDTKEAECLKTQISELKINVAVITALLQEQNKTSERILRILDNKYPTAIATKTNPQAYSNHE